MRITQRISNLQEAVSDSDIIITITPSHTPLIQKEWVKPGTHFSCIGADMAGKEEIDSQIFEDAIVFVDDLEHCRNAGEIEIPLKQGTLSEDRICGELGADQSLTKEFLAMGVDELSVSPGSILPLRKIILETNVTDYKAGKEC